MAINIERIRPIRDYVLIRKCAIGDELDDDGNRGIMSDDGQPLLYFDELTADTTEYFEIVRLGSKCKMFTPETVGTSVKCPPMHKDMYPVTNDDQWWLIKETAFDMPAVFTEDTIIPLWDAILTVSPNQKEGAVEIREQAEKPGRWGTVISVGPGRITQSGQRIPVVPKPGDRIYLPIEARLTIEWQGETHTLVQECDAILGVMEQMLHCAEHLLHRHSHLSK